MVKIQKGMMVKISIDLVKSCTDIIKGKVA
jgi:hypothetical protein